MGQEYELKFKATEQLHRSVQERFPGGWQMIQMQTTYYDTPDARLGAMRCTLRRRFENGVSICTLKTPEKNGIRGEWEIEKESIEEAVPILCKLCGMEELAFLDQSPLAATCGAQFTRLAKILELPDYTVEIALDRGVLTGGNRQMPLCELEVELKSGDTGAAAAFARELAWEFSLEKESASKFRRAMTLIGD